LRISNEASGAVVVDVVVDAGVSVFILSSASASADLGLSSLLPPAAPVVLVAVASDVVLASSCIESLVTDLPFFAYDNTALATLVFATAAFGFNNGGYANIDGGAFDLN